MAFSNTVSQGPGKKRVWENPCAKVAKGINTPSVKRRVKRQRQGKCQNLGMDLGPILERHHRLTLAA